MTKPQVCLCRTLTIGVVHSEGQAVAKRVVHVCLQGQLPAFTEGTENRCMARTPSHQSAERLLLIVKPILSNTVVTGEASV